MAHEITSTDGVVLNQQPAWHGLGIVVDEAPTIKEALKLAGLEWEVLQTPVQATMSVGYESLTDDERETLMLKGVIDGITAHDTMFDVRREVPSHVVNYRSDTGQTLGVVGKGYKPVQNSELAEFVSGIADRENIKVETAGSLKAGKRVWFLLPTPEVITLPGDDVVKPYVLISNGHDGASSLWGMATSVRVVCNNTLGFALKNAEGLASEGKAFRFSHTGGIMDRVEEARGMIGDAVRGVEQFREQLQSLVRVQMTEQTLQEFFVGVYAASWGMPATNPANEAEERALKRCYDRVAQWLVNFGQGAGADGASAKGTAWGALNAVTEWSDHDRTVQAGDRPVWEARADSNLFGTSARFKKDAFAAAMALV